MTETISLLEFLNEPLKITKPIRLIELFAGYGSQALALKYLGVPFEHWKIAEWNYKSFNAYNRLHMADTEDYSKGKTKEWLVDYLIEKGISADWNKPMAEAQIKRLSEHQIRKIYNDIQATHNLVNISQITGNDLEINDDRYTYILTYSFPCQDLSLAGNRAGMGKDSGTRSGLLWEVERLLNECEKKPDILLMENVTQVRGTANMPLFRDWMLSLEKMGYQNYWQDMIATDYGAPQIRDRTFMVSVYGEYYFRFPKPCGMKKKLTDLLETEAKHKFYLSDRAVNGMINSTFLQATMESRTPTKEGYIPTIAARDGKDPKLIVEKEIPYEIKPAHGYFPGSAKQAETISAIDAHINNQHIVLGHYTAEEFKTTKEKLRIRKLTPTECFRLMGVSDEDIAKLHGISDSTKYHLAGDSIVTTCLMAIFGEMFGIDWKEKIEELMNDWNNGTQSLDEESEEGNR